MKVACLQENLSKGLGIVGRAVASKTTLPILNNILIAAEEARLRLFATNLEIAITSWVGAKVEEEGAIAIPARLLTEFINSLPPDKVEMTVSPRTRSLHLVCGRYDAKINGMEAEDFPPVPTFGERPTATIDPEVLRQAITQVVFAAATDDSRPVLTGVFLKVEADQLTLAAADGFRLAVHRAALAYPSEEEVQLIVPAHTLSDLAHLLADQEEPVEMALHPNRNQMLFRLKNVDVISQLIQGTFPNYTQLIPTSYTNRAKVSSAEFLRATRIASIFARDSSGIIRLQIAPGEGGLAPGKITITARAEEIAENLCEIDAVVEGEPAKIAFNGKYLTDVLSRLTAEQVALETTSPSSPGVLRPVGAENYTHVVMPMFVQW